MIPPGYGIGSIITLCQWVWKQYNDFRDAPYDFNPISSQANTCLTALKKVETELRKPKSLIHNAESEAYIFT